MCCLYVETEEMLLLEVFDVLEYSSELPSGEIVITPHLFNVLVTNLYDHHLESQVDSFRDGFPNSYVFAILESYVVVVLHPTKMT